MSTVIRNNLVSVEDYLASEACATTKSEYLRGAVYAMVSGTNLHNQIATNVVGCLYARLQGHVCRPFNSDTRIRIRLPGETRYYYPDASVICRPNADNDLYQDHPALIVEVLSPSTRRTDEGEKKDAYLAIPSLTGYLLVEPDVPQVAAYWRSDDGFTRQDYAGLDAMIAWEDPVIELPLSEIYH